MMHWEDAYKYIPRIFSDAAKTAYGMLPLRIRWGNEYFKELKSLEESQWWSRQELENLQNEKLRHLIEHAYKNVPYYRTLFKDSNLKPSDIRTVNDLYKVPILTKDTVKQHYKEMLATNIKMKQLVRFSTSGTTGRPLIFYTEKRLEFFNFGPYMWRYYRWGKEEFNDLKLFMSSWILPKDKNGKRSIISYNPARRLLIFSSYDINRNNINLFAEAMKRYKPTFIETFPASLEALIKLFKECGIKKPIAPKAIFTNSEVLYPWQRNLFSDYFGCDVFDIYSLEERVVISAECDAHEHYHIFSEYGIVEFVNEGKIVVDGKSGDIIATSLDNHGMPFIRYKTGDIGYSVKEKCPCGRGLPLMELRGGRKRNYVLSKSGSLISVTIVDIPEATDNVHQFQFSQKEKGLLELKIVKKDGFSDNDMLKIKKKLKEKFSDDMNIKIGFVGCIDKTKSAKQPLLVQKLNI